MDIDPTISTRCEIGTPNSNTVIIRDGGLFNLRLKLYHVCELPEATVSVLVAAGDIARAALPVNLRGAVREGAARPHPRARPQQLGPHLRLQIFSPWFEYFLSVSQHTCPQARSVRRVRGSQVTRGWCAMLVGSSVARC